MLQNVTTMDVLSRCERQYIRFTVGTICLVPRCEELGGCVEYTLVRSLPGFRPIIAGALVHMLPSLLRTIAGRVVRKDDVKLDEEYDSISIASGLHSRSQYLIVKDLGAVLPCFIIVLD
ncbi:hypothetical protein H5410_060134 [Solanum commersonii]|uniref:Uncharacterized protein n=1 Tax=Solanum commersonii TaxID=4109 RepID=A0A9J5W540_SOLCO|nr:hypothetical protein H5410_060134 [Solanum commersonii]